MGLTWLTWLTEQRVLRLSWAGACLTGELTCLTDEPGTNERGEIRDWSSTPEPADPLPWAGRPDVIAVAQDLAS